MAEVKAEPIDGNQNRAALAVGEIVVAPDGNAGTITSKALHCGTTMTPSYWSATVEFREDWCVEYPVALLRRPVRS